MIPPWSPSDDEFTSFLTGGPLFAVEPVPAPQTTEILPGTEAAFWVDVHGTEARWRTATKKAHRCCNHGKEGTGCPDPGEIPVGSRYFDTGEVVGQWATAKLCPACANRRD